MTLWKHIIGNPLPPARREGSRVLRHHPCDRRGGQLCTEKPASEKVEMSFSISFSISLKLLSRSPAIWIEVFEAAPMCVCYVSLAERFLHSHRAEMEATIFFRTSLWTAAVVIRCEANLWLFDQNMTWIWHEYDLDIPRTNDAVCWAVFSADRPLRLPRMLPNSLGIGSSDPLHNFCRVSARPKPFPMSHHVVKHSLKDMESCFVTKEVLCFPCQTNEVVKHGAPCLMFWCQKLI